MDAREAMREEGGPCQAPLPAHTYPKNIMVQKWLDGQCGWKAPGQSPQQEGVLDTFHGSEQLGHCDCLEKKTGDAAVGWAPYHRCLLPPGQHGPLAGTGRGQGHGAEPGWKPFTERQALEDPRVSTYRIPSSASRCFYTPILADRGRERVSDS